MQQTSQRYHQNYYRKFKTLATKNKDYWADNRNYYSVQIQKMLFKRQKIKIVDPAYSHLFLSWNDQKKNKIKSQRSVSIQVEDNKIFKKYAAKGNSLIQELEESCEQKDSDKIYKKQQINVNLNQIKLPKVNQRKKLQKSTKIEQAKQEVGRYTQIRKNSIAKITPRKKASSLAQVKVRLQQPKRNQEKEDISLNYSLQHNLPTKVKKNMKKQWMKINPLQLQTLFIKMKKNQLKGKKDNFQIQSQVKRAFFYFPPKQQITTFIKKYQPMDKFLSIDELVKKQQFNIDIDQQEFYFGDMVQNKKHGFGIQVTKKNIFEGKWYQNMKINGYEKTNAGIYKGDFLNNKRQGQGQYFWSNGEYYCGSWKKGLKDGNGIWKSKKGDSYMGQWKNGKVEGYGMHITKDGQSFQGNFINCLKHGLGKQIFPNGDKFQGSYQQGEPNGKGRYQWKSGYIFEGQFKNSYRTGIGKMIGLGGFQFNGLFQNDYPNGSGELKLPNNDYYKGFFKDGLKNGQGVLNMPRLHKIYKGLWKNDRFQE